MKRIYLAGPMTGLPEKNYPAFHAEAARLRALGYEVVSPAEIWPLDAEGPWSMFMRGDITAMLTCDTVAQLGGWLKSKGAVIEMRLAFDVGMTIVSAEEITRGPAA